MKPLDLSACHNKPKFPMQSNLYFYACTLQSWMISTDLRVNTIIYILTLSVCMCIKLAKIQHNKHRRLPVCDHRLDQISQRSPKYSLRQLLSRVFLQFGCLCCCLIYSVKAVKWQTKYSNKQWCSPRDHITFVSRRLEDKSESLGLGSWSLGLGLEHLVLVSVLKKKSCSFWRLLL